MKILALLLFVAVVTGALILGWISADFRRTESPLARARLGPEVTPPADSGIDRSQPQTGSAVRQSSPQKIDTPIEIGRVNWQAEWMPGSLPPDRVDWPRLVLFQEVPG